MQLGFSNLSVPGSAAYHNSKFASVLSKQNKIKTLVNSILKKKKEKGAGHNFNGTHLCGY